MLSLLNPVGSPCGTSILGRSEDLETREGGRAEVGETERESAKNRVEVVIERWTDASGRGTEADRRLGRDHSHFRQVQWLGYSSSSLRPAGYAYVG